ncbi:MAG: tetratricopeptide repeat protein, partial [Thiohalomonadales bacterium]
LERLGWAFISKARRSFDPGYYKLAEQTAICMESKQVNNHQAQLLHGHVLHNLHKFKQAETLAKNLVAQRGLWFDYGLLGDVLMEQGKLEAAINAYQEMMNQRPGAQSYSRAAQIRWLKGDVNGAIEMMSLSISSLSTRDRESIAWAQTRLAQLLMQKNLIKKAQLSIDRALHWQENYPPALLLRGRMELARQDSISAENTLRIAVKGNTLPEYQWLLLDALRLNGRTLDADKIETQLLSRGEIEDPRTLALYLATMGKDIRRALRLAKKELIVRTDVNTLDAFAWALYANGEISEAFEYSKLALLEGTEDARLLLHATIIASAAGNITVSAGLWRKLSKIQHMLLPSEQLLLSSKFAPIQSQIPSQSVHRLSRRGISTL